LSIDEKGKKAFYNHCKCFYVSVEETLIVCTEPMARFVAEQGRFNFTAVELTR